MPWWIPLWNDKFSYLRTSPWLLGFADINQNKELATLLEDMYVLKLQGEI